jgi:two-component system OmpR family response regulator
VGYRVLVVEDDVRLARLMARALEEDGNVVALSHDGEAALAQAERASFDVVVLDLMLPRLDGLDVCAALRDQGLEVGVLMLTARDSVEDRIAGLEAGADDYLGKPFAFAELLARVRALGRRMTPGGVLRVGQLTLDPVARSSYCQGRPLELSVREFDLLEQFLRHQSQVLSRAQLLERVWGPDAEPTSNLVDVYVHLLRQKLGEEARLIRAVRGAGYVLHAPDSPGAARTGGRAR